MRRSRRGSTVSRRSIRRTSVEQTTWRPTPFPRDTPRPRAATKGVQVPRGILLRHVTSYAWHAPCLPFSQGAHESVSTLFVVVTIERPQRMRRHVCGHSLSQRASNAARRPPVDAAEYACVVNLGHRSGEARERSRSGTNL